MVREIKWKGAQGRTERTEAFSNVCSFKFK